MLCYDDSVIDFYAMPVSKGRENDGVSGMKVSGTPTFSVSCRFRRSLYKGGSGHTLFRIVSSVRGYHV
ncbi:hypothetical protein D3Z60_09940 [Lachnospiraceae bacterium]|nr:hypothetical protein [Lachnospiraceae bacterium]